ncbi:MAG: D-arabinono-1,4-lactone oxidase, partial [Acidimicrobiales bacterium]|nr:D-arabinono-1,4-lactone oxidase [Acidimicrobiales bacterium]
MKDRTAWTNWAGNQSCAPTSNARQTSEDEQVALVRSAAEAGTRVKCVGAGHSFTPIACTDGVLVDLSGYGRFLHHDPETRRVTVQAGISLSALSEELDLRGLALENMGDIAYQSIAGATATATHGTGWHFGNISSRIVGMRLIAGDGSIVVADASENPDVLASARVGVGALGIVSTVTIQAVPAFRLHAIESPMPIDELLADFDGYMSSADHVEFYWVPHTAWALTKRNRRTDEPAVPRGRVKQVVDDVLLPNVGFGALCRIGRRRPSLIPRLATILPSTGRVDYTDRSDKVFTSPRLVRFYEMEYAIPRQAVPEALNRVRRLVDERGLRISFPVEVRVAAPDDIPLSTAHGRATGYIAVHVYKGTPYDAYFQGVETIMNSYGGRPHWGKMHFRTAEDLRP